MATEARSKSGMGSQRLASPMLGSSIPCRSWKNKLQMWTLVCGVDKKTNKQGIIVLLQSLSNNKKPGKAVSNLTSVELYTENMFKFIIRKIRCCISIRMLKMHIFF